MRMTEVAELRRETVAAVVRQQRLREDLSRVQARAAWVEERAWRAFGRGDEILARQILARGICTLKERDGLEEELTEASRHVIELLAAMVRAENRSWHAVGRPEAAVMSAGVRGA
jgi:phage shock protein A